MLYTNFRLLYENNYERRLIMGFKPVDSSVNKIFSGDNRYKIPKFQRDFSWDEDNFNDFFNDLFKSSGITIENIEVDPENKYFFGMILLLGDESTPKIKEPYEVIDGQQRLTTMTLFFAAIRDIINETKPEYQTNIGEKLSVKLIESGNSTDLARLEVSESIAPIFRVDILNLDDCQDEDASDNPDSNGQKWLMDSFNYFKELLGKKNIAKCLGIKIKDLDDALYVRILESLGKHLGNATLIGIYHQKKDEANKLFRNLNYRGKLLGQTDLIKNELFYILGENYAPNRWSKIESNIEDSSEGMQSFIYHYMCGRYSSITKNNMFEKFLDYLDPSNKIYNQFLKLLLKASQYYKIILKPNENDTVFKTKKYFKVEDNPSVKRNLEFFNDIEISQYRILMITLFECRDKNVINNKLFKKFINQIALHQSIHLLVKSSANTLTSVYGKTSRDLLEFSSKKESNHNSRTNDANKIYDEFKKKLKEKLPEKSRVIESDLQYSGVKVENMNAKDRKDFALVKYILCKLSDNKQCESFNRGNDGLAFIYSATIEHIIDKEEQIDNVYNLGNLLLLERHEHKNTKGLDSKKEMYSGSKITKTNTFFEAYPDFDESKIPERRKKLLSDFYSLVKNSK